MKNIDFSNRAKPTSFKLQVNRMSRQATKQHGATRTNENTSRRMLCREARVQQQYLQRLGLEVQTLKLQRDRDPVIQALTKRNECLEKEIQYLHTQAMIMARKMFEKDNN
ncbi:uncharacterized protein FPRO_07351 [Fusarium proliferatum ET1]|uniref:Uncharacterized protein n=1 Tax=Fusarium proliferatum (strain ET1) TaxID=1227346 RepID=A0A1L7VTI3_FUSPR|nr:uncharacterized protein FPRO_07351 [Fusarium proliferatum ET1]CZR43732.1 uncharacterized protein FPRO_07351 [Fusarium proliferatum ET1]